MLVWAERWRDRGPVHRGLKSAKIVYAIVPAAAVIGENRDRRKSA